ncbi:MAG: hypothetical protein ACOYIH_03415 [Candidatus Fimadaptatus sp.]|jgi:hypothetical protein
MKLTDLKQRRNITILAALALTIAAIVAALLIARQPTERPAAQQQAQIARGSMLTLRTTYSLCGHTELSNEVLVCPEEQLSREGLCALYPGWQLTAFSQDGAELSRALDLPCPKHYLIKLSGSRLTLERLIDGQITEAGSASVSREALDPELIARLERGQIADSLAQAERMIEDMES